MKKSDLTSHVATQAALSKAQAHSAVDALFSAITEALARGARQGRNPQSSPRGRGTRAGDRVDDITGRIIPAWAGNTSMRLRLRSTPPGHPRVGGEH